MEPSVWPGSKAGRLASASTTPLRRRDHRLDAIQHPRLLLGDLGADLPPRVPEALVESAGGVAFDDLAASREAQPMIAARSLAGVLSRLPQASGMRAKLACQRGGIRRPNLRDRHLARDPEPALKIGEARLEPALQRRDLIAELVAKFRRSALDRNIDSILIIGGTRRDHLDRAFARFNQLGGDIASNLLGGARDFLAHSAAL